MSIKRSLKYSVEGINFSVDGNALHLVLYECFFYQLFGVLFNVICLLCKYFELIFYQFICYFYQCTIISCISQTLGIHDPGEKIMKGYKFYIVLKSNAYLTVGDLY